MYGLPQAGMLANKLLKERLEVHNYYKVPHTPGLFTHKTRPIWFTLTVDDFGVKYIGKEHAEHLMAVLGQHYNMEQDWKEELYCGITLKWNYNERYVDISMSNHVHKKLIEYEHERPKRDQHCPYAPPPVRYGKDLQLITLEKESPPATDTEKKYIRKVLGSFFVLCARN